MIRDDPEDRQPARRDSVGSLLLGGTSIGLALIALGVMIAQLNGHPHPRYFETRLVPVEDDSEVLETAWMPRADLMLLPGIAVALAIASMAMAHSKGRRLPPIATAGLVCGGVAFVAWWLYLAWFSLRYAYAL